MSQAKTTPTYLCKTICKHACKLCFLPDEVVSGEEYGRLQAQLTDSQTAVILLDHEVEKAKTLWFDEKARADKLELKVAGALETLRQMPNIYKGDPYFERLRRQLTGENKP